MKKENRIKKNNEIDAIIQNKKSSGDRFFVIYYKDNNLPYLRYAISIGRKYGGAVLRNKIKRQIRMIIHMQAETLDALDYVIVVKKDASTLAYQSIETSLNKQLSRHKKPEHMNEKL